MATAQNQLNKLKDLNSLFIIKPTTKVYIYSGNSDISNIYSKYNEIYFKDNTESWIGYTGQETIIINKFDPEQWYDFDVLNTVINNHPLRVKTERGVVNFISKNFVIITQDHPNNWNYKYSNLQKLGQKLSNLISVR